MADLPSASPFSVKIVAVVVVAGVLAFLGFLFLSAYAPQMKARGGHGVHPMSKAAVGFYGLYHLAEATGRVAELYDQESDWGRTGFEAVTIDMETDPARLRKLVTARRAVDNSKTLYIMPKWVVVPMLGNDQRVQSFGALPAEWSTDIIGVFGRIHLGQAKRSGGRIHGVEDSEMAGIVTASPDQPHFVASGMTPVLVDDAGHALMGRIDFDNGASDYILADPDLLSNQAMKTPQGAFAALKMVDAMRASASDSVAFDLALNNVRAGRNLLQLMFEPPFLALTLSVLAAALLVGIHAFGRFGPPIAEPRALPFGKRALADNAAMLIGRAGAVRRMGDRYVALVRDSVAARLGAASMETGALEGWLAKLPNVHGPDFGTLAADARNADTGEAVRAAASALHSWKNEVIGDR